MTDKVSPMLRSSVLRRRSGVVAWEAESVKKRRERRDRVRVGDTTPMPSYTEFLQGVAVHLDSTVDVGFDPDGFSMFLKSDASRPQRLGWIGRRLASLRMMRYRFGQWISARVECW